MPKSGSNVQTRKQSLWPQRCLKTEEHGGQMLIVITIVKAFGRWIMGNGERVLIHTPEIKLKFADKIQTNKLALNYSDSDGSENLT